MNSDEFKTQIKNAATHAIVDFEFDCDGIYDCNKTCPYYGDVDSSEFNCIIIQTEHKLRKLRKISEVK